MVYITKEGNGVMFIILNYFKFKILCNMYMILCFDGVFNQFYGPMFA